MRIGHTVRKAAAMAILGITLLVAGDQTCQAAETGYIEKRIEELKVKFPEGKYWNHVGSSKDNVDGYTSSPCKLHKIQGIHILGTGGCTCNHFVNEKHGYTTTQCMGFSYKLGFDVFGDVTWKKMTADPVANVKVGDVVRLDYDSHSVFVIGKKGTVITVGEANYPNSCIISWSRTINLASANVTYYERAENYQKVAAQKVETVPQAQKGNVTGWLKDDEGNAFYEKDGVVLTDEWLDVDGSRYYVDMNGNRVSGFCDVNGSTYYFDQDGVLQTKQWLTLGENSYYADDNGAILKNQWLKLGKVKVYVTADGAMAKNKLVQIGSKTYLFGADGKRSKGFHDYNGKYYYTNKNGVVQKKEWIKKSGEKYYVQKSGVRAQDKLLKIGKYRYYFNAQGQMMKRQKINLSGKVYQADVLGRCKIVAYGSAR